MFQHNCKFRCVILLQTNIFDSLSQNLILLTIQKYCLLFLGRSVVSQQKTKKIDSFAFDERERETEQERWGGVKKRKRENR